MNIGSDIGYAVGVAGIALTLVQHWTERRRARPVVITNEAQKRRIKEGPKVFVTNDSAIVAFNVRYGINIVGVHVPWKHDQRDPEASRVNVLGPGDREPSEGTREIVIPDNVLFAAAGKDQDPDEGRFYWAYYHGPGGDWWYTRNPASRSDNLKIERLRAGALGWRKRKLDRALEEGDQVLRKAIAEAQPSAPGDTADHNH